MKQTQTGTARRGFSLESGQVLDRFRIRKNEPIFEDQAVRRQASQESDRI